MFHDIHVKLVPVIRFFVSAGVHDEFDDRAALPATFESSRGQGKASTYQQNTWTRRQFT